VLQASAKWAPKATCFLRFDAVVMPVLHRFVAAGGVLSRPPFPSRPLARVVDLAAGP